MVILVLGNDTVYETFILTLATADSTMISQKRCTKLTLINGPSGLPDYAFKDVSGSYNARSLWRLKLAQPDSGCCYKPVCPYLGIYESSLQ